MCFVLLVELNMRVQCYSLCLYGTQATTMRELQTIHVQTIRNMCKHAVGVDYGFVAVFICMWVSDSIDMVYYCTCTQDSLVQYPSFIWHSLHRSTVEYHTKVSVYLLSLVGDPPSPDNVYEQRCVDGEERV